MTRLNNLLKQFSSQKIDGLLVSQPANVSYLCGFSSSDSWLLVTPKKCVYLTDLRYVEQVKGGLRGISLARVKKDIFMDLARLCRRLKVKNLGFESRSFSFLEYKRLKSVLPVAIKIKNTLDLVESLRQIKEPQEIEKIKRAIGITSQAFDYLKTAIKEGKAESRLAGELEYFVRQKGCRLSFEPIIAGGINSVYPHAGISLRKIRKNEPITVDIGIDFQGYKSDLTRVFFLGKIPLFFRRVYGVILAAQERAIKAISAGQPASKIDGLARNFIKHKGLGRFFGHSLGHGVGLEVHEKPLVSWKNKAILKENMVITVEPGIYLPGKFGMRIEDMVLVKRKGCEVLSGFIDKSN